VGEPKSKGQLEAICPWVCQEANDLLQSLGVFLSPRLSPLGDLISDKFIDLYIYSDIRTEDSENTKSKIGFPLILTNR